MPLGLGLDLRGSSSPTRLTEKFRHTEDTQGVACCCRSWLASEGCLEGAGGLGVVGIRCCGNGRWRFRPYGEGLCAYPLPLVLRLLVPLLQLLTFVSRPECRPRQK